MGGHPPPPLCLLRKGFTTNGGWQENTGRGGRVLLEKTQEVTRTGPWAAYPANIRNVPFIDKRSNNAGDNRTGIWRVTSRSPAWLPPWLQRIRHSPVSDTPLLLQLLFRNFPILPLCSRPRCPYQISGSLPLGKRRAFPPARTCFPEYSLKLLFWPIRQTDPNIPSKALNAANRLWIKMRRVSSHHRLNYCLEVFISCGLVTIRRTMEWGRGRKRVSIKLFPRYIPPDKPWIWLAHTFAQNVSNHWRKKENKRW